MNDDVQQNAFEYLMAESDRLTREVASIEKRIEEFESCTSISFTSGHIDPRYKRLVDKSEMLSANLCQIRLKVAEFMTAGDKGKASSTSSIPTAPSPPIPSGPSFNPGAHFGAGGAGMQGKPISFQHPGNAMPQPQKPPGPSVNPSIVAVVPDGIVATLDRAPGGRTNTSMQVDQTDDTVVYTPQQHARASNNPMDSGASVASSNTDFLFHGQSSLQSANNNNKSFVNGGNGQAQPAQMQNWPTLNETVFHGRTAAPSYPQNNGGTFPGNAGFSMSTTTNKGGSPFGMDFSFNASSGGSSISTHPQSFQLGNNDSASMQTLNLFNHQPPGLSSPPAMPMSSLGLLDSTVLQTEEYVAMKKHVASLMKQFHEKKLYFVALDGSPVFAQQYQVISQHVKNGESIANFLRGKMLNYVTGVDKKKQTVQQMDLFLPDHFVFH